MILGPELCKSIIEKCEAGRSQDYYFITEDEAIKRCIMHIELNNTNLL